MTRTYKTVINNSRLLHFLLKTNIYDDIKDIKYKTIERITESVHHYGWSNVHLYALGTYQLNNGNEINFDYCYEMDPNNIKNIKCVVSCHLYYIVNSQDNV